MELRTLIQLGIIILDTRQDFKPKQSWEKMFDDICFMRVGHTDLAVKVVSLVIHQKMKVLKKLEIC